MFQINDVVVYGSQGVCEIVGIDEKKIDGVIYNYFVLKPKNDNATTFYVPTWNEKAWRKMRKVMTKKDVNDVGEGEYSLETLPEIGYFNQMNTMLETEEEAERIVLKIEEKYKNILTPLQNGECIDIVPFGVNKANGIYGLLKVIGCEYDDVITVGDNINDTHMIKEFRSYAMVNGVEKIKALADYVTLGITELIETELGVTIDE